MNRLNSIFQMGQTPPPEAPPTHPQMESCHALRDLASLVKLTAAAVAAAAESAALQDSLLEAV